MRNIITRIAQITVIIAGFFLAESAGAQVNLLNYSISYGGRSYDALTDTTTFNYLVTPQGPVNQLNFVNFELPVNCNPALAVGATEPADSATTPVIVTTDPATRIYGVKFDFALQPTDPARSIAITMNGNLPEISGKVGVRDGAGSVTSGEITVPGCPLLNAAAVTPIVECVEDLGNGQRRAHFGYLNSNQWTVPVASDSADPSGAQNFFDPDQQNSQLPDQFLPGRQIRAFSQDFSGGSFSWTLQVPGTTAVTVTVDDGAPPCQAVVPFLSCVEQLSNTTFRAHMSYENLDGSAATIPVGPDNYVTSNSSGMYNPTPADPADRGQPTEFAPGRSVDIFRLGRLDTEPVTIPEWNGAPLTWVVRRNGITRSVTVSSASMPCYLSLKPLSICVYKSCEGMDHSIWGYIREQPFVIVEPQDGNNNYFTPDVPPLMQPGDVNYPFAVEFTDGEIDVNHLLPLTWHLGRITATADSESRLCEENVVPACSAPASAAAECVNGVPTVSLTGSGTDADENCVHYAWSTQCPGAVVDTPAAATTTVTFANPPSATQCDVTLTVSDQYVAAPCAPTSVTVPSCAAPPDSTTTTTTTTTTSTVTSITGSTTSTMPAITTTTLPGNGCTEVSSAPALDALRAALVAQRKFVAKTSKAVLKAGANSAARRLATRSQQKALGNLKSAEELLKLFPGVISKCGVVPDGCQPVSFAQQVADLQKLAMAQQNLARKLTRKLAPKSRKRLLARNSALFQELQTISAGLGDGGVRCG